MFVHHFILVYINKAEKFRQFFCSIAALSFVLGWQMILSPTIIICMILVFNGSAMTINVFLYFYYKLDTVKRIFIEN